jgi:hypothetical protein|tara:strand:+ start:482 stop:736 length:255 start_codon:yes stop_codon:yes gene_type:complete
LFEKQLSNFLVSLIYATCSVRSGDVLPLVSSHWETRQAAKDAQTPGHRDVDHPAEDRLATVQTASLSNPFVMTHCLCEQHHSTA